MGQHFKKCSKKERGPATDEYRLSKRPGLDVLNQRTLVHTLSMKGLRPEPSRTGSDTALQKAGREDAAARGETWLSRQR